MAGFEHGVTHYVKPERVYWSFQPYKDALYLAFKSQSFRRSHVWEKSGDHKVHRFNLQAM